MKAQTNDSQSLGTVQKRRPTYGLNVDSGTLRINVVISDETSVRTKSRCITSKTVKGGEEGRKNTMGRTGSTMTEGRFKPKYFNAYIKYK